MELILYKTHLDKGDLAKPLSASPDSCCRKINVTDYPDYENFIAGLGGRPPGDIITATNGVNGTEGMITTQNARQNVPVLRFSEDGGFGIQFYRRGCAYFHQNPLSPEAFSAALAKCMKQNICKGEIR